MAQVLKYLLQEARDNGFEASVLCQEKGMGNGTLQSATVQIKGKNLEPYLKNWIGTIQWVGKSQFRKFHKRKNWFVGVYELNQIQFPHLNEKDIEFQTMRSSGSGGQHVNKVSSAVRAIHKSTGVQAVSQDSRSQHRNKKQAIERLKEKVYTLQMNQLKDNVKDEWENHLNVQRGNPVRVFHGSDFKSKKENKNFKSKRNQLKNDLRNELNY